MASWSDSYQTFASFGLVNGVLVKISDKFQPPKRITLPAGWKDVDPSELLSFQYDFSKEKSALAQAEEESLNRLRQLQQKEEEQRLKKEEEERLRQEEEERLRQEEEQAKLRQLELEEEARLKQLQEEENQKQQEHTISENQVSVGSSTQPVSTPSVDILTPLVVTNTNIQKQQKQNHIFDPLEFENQNDNPFELVERATLNEFDELRSVLEPEVTQPTRKVIKAAAGNSKPDDFELSSVFFNPPPSVAQTQDENTEEIITITETVSNVTQDHVYTNEGFNLIPHQPSKGTLTWTQFDLAKQQQTIINPFNPMNPFSTTFQSLDMIESDRNPNSLLSKTPPPNVGRMSLHNSTQYLENSNGYETSNTFVNPTPIPRTKSLPNLQDQNDYENYENISIIKQDGSPNYNGVRFTNSQDNSPLSQSQQPIPTDRIENIMKQFQFQRMGPQSTPPTQPVNNSLGNNMNNLGVGSPEEGNANVPNANFPVSSAANQFGVSIASSGNYVAPYMVPSSNPNQNFMSYSQPQQPIATPVYSTYQSDYSSGGPMMIHSRPLSMNSNVNVGTPSDSVINLNPSTAAPSSEGQINYPIRQSLPPIASPSADTNRIYSVPAFGTRQPDNTAPPLPYPRQSVANPIPPTERGLPPRRPESAKLPDLDLKSSQSLPLPSIVSNLTFLQDMYPSLSTSEKNFANQLNAMGFPLPCVSRTIKRLGMNDKEVLDFLVLVEELKESTKKEGDDIEMALQNNNCDKVKATSYLEMVATFQELGFQQKKIHEALKETACDQNSALDYLTR